MGNATFKNGKLKPKTLFKLPIKKSKYLKTPNKPKFPNIAIIKTTFEPFVFNPNRSINNPFI